MNKTLILVRHAHREKNLESDNGLSAKGKLQAQAISDRLNALHSKSKPFLVSSPKKRCRETLLPLAGGNAQAITIMSALDEGATGSIQKRINEFMDWWESDGPQLTIACSHGDWIPYCVESLTQVRLELRKGAWVELEQIEGPKGNSKISLRWVTQQF